jgi:hypothetical protein
MHCTSTSCVVFILPLFNSIAARSSHVHVTTACGLRATLRLAGLSQLLACPRNSRFSDIGRSRYVNAAVNAAYLLLVMLDAFHPAFRRRCRHHVRPILCSRYPARLHESEQ